MRDRLKGKVAIVTGSTSGMGHATAELFAVEGASVIVNGRRRELGQQVTEGILAQGGAASYFCADVGKSDDLRNLIQFAVDTYGRLDILINNAYSGHTGSVVDMDEEAWDYAFAVIVKAVALGSKYAIPEMMKVGGGAIVNVSSVHGFMVSRSNASYDALKAALINLTRQMAADYGKDGIRVNALCPGWIVTADGFEWFKSNPDQVRRQKAICPLGRPGKVSEMAQVVLFLASDASSFVTGHALVADGGLTTQLQDTVAGLVESSLKAT